ncbi:hypothetical protein GCK32_021131 [Trichostrongylus colubriformis]|uniref:Uncharacterized protein n=1 Tax=Trichostrongylus colubriformis TaxID=6319 RepID=A0AAN8FJA2_TRICO
MRPLLLLLFISLSTVYSASTTPADTSDDPIPDVQESMIPIRARRGYVTSGWSGWGGQGSGWNRGWSGTWGGGQPWSGCCKGWSGGWTSGWGSGSRPWSGWSSGWGSGGSPWGGWGSYVVN